jgi:chemotaxis protein MotB
MTNYKPHYYSADVTNRWVFSYADMVTILLVLFVAVSAKELRKLDVSPPPKDAIRKPSAAGPREDLLRVQRVLAQHGLHPKLEPRGLVVSLPQAILFPSGEDRVSPDALPMIGRVAEAIRDIPNKVIFSGHADAVPIHNHRFRDNWMLSVARSLSLLEVMSKYYGIPESRLSVPGYSSYEPLEPNDTEQNRAANRRVEVIILREASP